MDNSLKLALILLHTWHPHNDVQNKQHALKWATPNNNNKCLQHAHSWRPRAWHISFTRSAIENNQQSHWITKCLQKQNWLTLNILNPKVQNITPSLNSKTLKLQPWIKTWGFRVVTTTTLRKSQTTTSPIDSPLGQNICNLPSLAFLGGGFNWF